MVKFKLEVDLKLARDIFDTFSLIIDVECDLVWCRPIKFVDKRVEVFLDVEALVMFNLLFSEGIDSVGCDLNGRRGDLTQFLIICVSKSILFENTRLQVKHLNIFEIDRRVEVEGFVWLLIEARVVILDRAGAIFEGNIDLRVEIVGNVGFRVVAGGGINDFLPLSVFVGINDVLFAKMVFLGTICDNRALFSCVLPFSLSTLLEFEFKAFRVTLDDENCAGFGCKDLS